MKTMMSLLTATASIVIAAPASAAVYFVNQSIGSISVIGSVTTNDNIGSLQTGDITDFSLKLTSAANTVTLNSANAFFVTGGEGLVASSEALTFNFSNSANSFFYFFDGVANFVCGASGEQGGCTGVNNTLEATVDPTFVSIPKFGSYTFATAGAVPETATWGMMIAGFGMMGAAMRSRRPSTKVSFA
jgi:hypothetical protein